MTRKKILVIGANGFTGRRILDDLSRNLSYQTTGCSLHDDICPHSGNYRFIRTDICNRQAVEKLFQEVQPDVVINTSALSVPDYCETHHAEADAVNITAVEHLAECCEAGGSRFIHLSTDFVFGGDTDRPYTEEDIPAPVNYYGYTKLEGEKRIAAVCRDYAIVRVVVVYGAALPGQHGNVLQLVANRLRNNEEVFVVSDQWRTPTFVGDVSQGVEKLISHPQNGIYHLCGSECLTIADIAYRVADVLGLNRSLIRPVTTKEMNEKTPRPRFSGLSIEKAHRELGYQPYTLEEVFDLKTDLLDYVLENGFHVAGYLKQKALLSIDDSASQKGKGKGRSASAKEGQGSSKQADKEKRPRERKRDAAAVEVPTDVLHPELYNRLVAWRNAEASALGLPVYTVIQQKAILGISNLLPSDKAMLVRIPYFGKKGVEKYGDVILEMVRVYRKEKGLAEPELL